MAFLLALIPILVIIGAFAVRAAIDSGPRRPRSRKRSSTTSGRASSGAARPPQAQIAAPPIRPQPANSPKVLGSGLRWLGPEVSLEVAGITIPSALTYASGRRRPADAEDPSEIVTTALVRHGAAERLPYWPWYARATAAQRHEFLTWMSSGRATIPSQDGYLFIFFYGLERRALIDDADHALVFSEVLRLRRLDLPRAGTREGRSFRNYSDGLLWQILLRRPDAISVRLAREFFELRSRWDDESIAMALSWVAAGESRLPSWLAFKLAEASPDSRRSVVARSVPTEFEQLFEKRYAAAYGPGIELRSGARPVTHRYRPASAALDEVSIKGPNPYGIKSQFKALPEMWNSCIDDLRALSRIERDGELTSEAWEALPAELRRGVDHPLTRALCDAVARLQPDEGESIGSAGAIAAVCGIDYRPRLTLGQSRQIAATAEHIGFGLEPDARITGRSYAWDDDVAVFLLTSGGLDERRYIGAECVLRLGFAVAAADDNADEEEMDLLTRHIEDAFELNDAETRRLEALRGLLKARGGDIGWLAKRVQASIGEADRTKLARLLFAIAAADGVVTRSELQTIRRAGRILGLTAEAIESLVAEFSGADNTGLVTVQEAVPRIKGEPIPSVQEDAAVAFKLDRNAIHAIMVETREVAQILATALDSSLEEPAPAPATATATARVQVTSHPTEPPLSNGAGSSPPEKVAGLFDVLKDRRRTPLSEARAIARTHGLMLSGAIEEINDWSTDALGGPVLYEDGDDLVVELALLPAE